MKAYLAAKYMSGPKADAILAHASTDKPKRKKRKTTSSTAIASSSSTSFIKDDDVTGWRTDKHSQDEDEDASEAVVASDRGFKKKQGAGGQSAWATIREGEKEDEEPVDERPQVVVEDAGEEPFRGGLMTAAQMKKTFGKSKLTNQGQTQEEIAAAQETIYRDASGRKIDTAAERAEAARKKREREEKEAKKMEWGKGLVQREEMEKKRKEAVSLKGKAFSRTVDDAEMNETMKAEERWNDPAAAFLTVRIASVFCDTHLTRHIGDTEKAFQGTTKT